MIDFMNKYNSVVEHYQLEKSVLTDIACAICVADEHIGSNEKALNIDRLLVSTEVFNTSQNVSGVPQLPKVQVMRIMCDVLILALTSKGIELSEVYLTNPSASVVGKQFDFTKTKEDYADEFECIKIMDYLMDWEDDNEEIYQYIESVLSRLKNHDRSSSFTFDEVYLPSKYDSNGFPVNRENKSKNIDREYQFLSVFINNFCRYLINAADDMDFATRLITIFEEHIQIGIHGVLDKELFIDKLSKKYNVAVMNLYRFILSENIALTRESVEKVFQVFELFERDRVR